MSVRRIGEGLVRPQRGQTLILFTLLLGFVFLGVAAATVDLANYHVARRKLQNAADMAALASAEVYRSTSDASAAWTAANRYVAENMSGVTVVSPATGSGPGLTNGVEVTSSGVRVALQQNIDGLFSQAIGFPRLTVRARARAMYAPPNYVLPVAVKRFEVDTFGSVSSGHPGKDYLCQDHGLASYTISSMPAPEMAQSTCPWAAASDPGPAVPILGAAVSPNKPPSDTNSFNGWILPEQRNIDTSMVCYHNMCGSTNSYKGEVASYVGQNGGFTRDETAPWPAVGQTLAAFDGANTGTIVPAVEKRYQVGDIVTALVFDGNVQKHTGDNYITVLGYALFRISSVDNSNPDHDKNSIYARAISGLMTTPDNALPVQLPALAPW